MKRNFFEAEVVSCVQLLAGLFKIEFRAGQPLNVLPGQFIVLQSLCPENIWGRPFAVAWEEENNFTIIFEVKGKNTKKYSELKRGEKIKIIGPLGKSLAIDFANDHNIFVAGGIGMSGLRFVINNQAEKPHHPFHVYFGAKKQEFIYCLLPKNLKKYAAVKTITDEEGMVTDLLEKNMLKILNRFKLVKIIACGPEAMLRKTAQIAEKWGVPCQIMMETLMACGVGSCKGCVIPKIGGGNFHLCQDGPALPAEMVDWEKLERPSVIVSSENRRPVEEINMETVLIGQGGRKLILPSPIIIDSGCFTADAAINGPVDLTGVGAITSKGTTYNDQMGNQGPRVCETPMGMLNSIGLENIGLKTFIEKDLIQLKSLGKTVIANISASTAEEFASMAFILHEAGVKITVLNVSCPNKAKDKRIFGMFKEDTFEVTQAVRKEVGDDVFVIVKLTPMASDVIEVAMAAEQAGADALIGFNTYLGMKINLLSRQPAIANIFGGESGSSAMARNLRLVYLVCQKVKIPVVASTGITCGNDAAEYIIAGAQAVSIGAGIFSNPKVAPETFYGLREIVASYGMSDIKELVGSLILNK
ncbi:MAG: tRNA-dihydrouridine synthase [Patescibacteria group bacterium]